MLIRQPITVSITVFHAVVRPPPTHTHTYIHTSLSSLGPSLLGMQDQGRSLTHSCCPHQKMVVSVTMNIKRHHGFMYCMTKAFDRALLTDDLQKRARGICSLRWLAQGGKFGNQHKCFSTISKCQFTYFFLLLKKFKYICLSVCRSIILSFYLFIYHSIVLFFNMKMNMKMCLAWAKSAMFMIQLSDLIAVFKLKVSLLHSQNSGQVNQVKLYLYFSHRKWRWTASKCDA